jgi:hypothetical protein
VGDKLYGEKSSEQLAKGLELTRQFLHAWKLKIPEVGEFTAKLDPELGGVLTNCHIDYEQ